MYSPVPEHHPVLSKILLEKEQDNINVSLNTKPLLDFCKQLLSKGSVHNARCVSNTIPLIDLILPGTTHLLLQWKVATKHFLNQIALTCLSCYNIKAISRLVILLLQRFAGRNTLPSLCAILPWLKQQDCFASRQFSLVEPEDRSLGSISLPKRVPV